MIAVIIAGGVGSRLWPLSTPEKPKQLLPLVGELSLLRSTYERARLISEHIYVVVPEGLRAGVAMELPEIKKRQYIVEPARRGTGNCTLLALLEVEKRHGESEPVAFLYCDHVVRDNEGFKATFDEAARVACDQEKIVLIGLPPDKPSTGFGYIELLRELSSFGGIFHVGNFKEKPSRQTAQKFLRKGNYLWSSGYYVGTTLTFRREIAAHAPGLAKHYWRLYRSSKRGSDKLKKIYTALPKMDLQKELLEASRSMLVIRAAFDWMDVGNFGDLHAMSQHDKHGNTLRGSAIITSEVSRSFIYNETPDRPLIVSGLKDVVVVQTEQGVMVTHVKRAHEIGELSKGLDKI